ncbi:hypothetical protein [Acinetobacter johnsonii]|uniref:hypothetical protein n=1 Tax=Acinetobacter johnsonii TaxID=40214 RepID=UPI00132F9232|nr:hypothetical protein [Acinetobacter johnsonii]
MYPLLFDELSRVRKDIYKQLIEELKGPLQQYFEYEDEEQLYDQLDIILIERRLIDQAIGYIQTGEVFLHDEFLVRNILTKQELEAIFTRVRDDFWNNTIANYVQIYAGKPLTEEYTETLKKVLTVKDWYLPNLIPNWSIEDLFVDYMTIFLKYDKYENTAAGNTSKPMNIIERKRYPTAKETIQCVKPLFGYDQPLLNYKGAFIDFHTAENGEISSKYFGLNINLEHSAENLPHLLLEFMLAFMSRKMDYYRGGQKNAFQEGHDIQQAASAGKAIVDMLDKLNNRMPVLNRAISLISGLSALLYVDGVFEKASQIELSNLELINVIRICKFSNDLELSGTFDRTDPTVIEQLREQSLASFESYSIDELVQKIVGLFNEESEVKAELKIEAGKKPTQIVFSIENEKLSYELNIKDLKDKINRMLGHFFITEEENVLTGKSENVLGLSPIFTPLFQVI